MPSFESGASVSGAKLQNTGVRAAAYLPPRPEGAAATARIIGSPTEDQAPPKA
jgi:hypothetical protein